MDTSLIPVPSLSPQVLPQELAARMGRADMPLLLDVRREEKFLESRHMLAGARRCAPEDVAALATVSAS
ncbi:MAG: hypothetical protein ACREBY_12875, partial [Polaromonas sp.]